MKILVISGGSSSERKISLISSNQVKTALISKGYTVKLFDLKRGYPLLKEICRDADLAFPVLHGKDGEDGQLYKFLESQNIPYIGSDPKGAKMAFDKILFKKYCDKNNMPTAKWMMVKGIRDIKEFGLPCVLKAANGGSSKEVILIKSEKDLSGAQVKNLLKLDDQFYVERFLKGAEITVGVLEDRGLPAIEIIPKDGWFDYKNKYDGTTQEVVGAPSVDKETVKRAQYLSLQIHQNLKLGQYSRTDFIIVDNTPYILETNTPGGVGLTPESLYPKAAKAIGLDFPDLMDYLVKLAMKDHDQKNSI